MAENGSRRGTDSSASWLGQVNPDFLAFLAWDQRLLAHCAKELPESCEALAVS